MIDIAEVNARLVEQDEALRVCFAAITGGIGDASLRAIAGLVAEGLSAIHERQGNQILLSLQTGR